MNQSFKLVDFLNNLDDCSYLESLIVYHSAPTLQGIKPANLVNLYWPGRNVESIWECCKERLEKELGIRLKVLRKSETNMLLLVYQPTLLSFCTGCKSAQTFLTDYGYPVNSSHLDDWIEHLAQRFLENPMPHEVGIFLGYPLLDVSQFILNNGNAPKASGLWKVYGKIGRAQRKLRRYKEATSHITSLLHQGKTLSEIRLNLRKSSYCNTAV